MTPPRTLGSTLLDRLPGVRHRFFTREGGVSSGLYESLNLGHGSNDDPASVSENRRRAAASFDLAPDRLCICNQIHSAQVVITDKGFVGDRPAADGVISDRAGVLCGVLTADCAPVLIADADRRVVAAAHAGWRGALSGIVEATVEAMIRLGARRDALVAAIGPCIGPQSYEVGPEFLAQFTDRRPESVRFFAPGAAAGKSQFDLPGFVLWRLAAAGVEQSEWLGEDTFARKDLYFSNRRAVRESQSDYGRLLSAIALEA